MEEKKIKGIIPAPVGLVARFYMEDTHTIEEWPVDFLARCEVSHEFYGRFMDVCAFQFDRDGVIGDATTSSNFVELWRPEWGKKMTPDEALAKLGRQVKPKDMEATVTPS